MPKTTLKNGVTWVSATWPEIISRLFKLGLRYCTSWRPKEPYSNFRSEYLETLDELYHKSHFPWLKRICDEYDFSLMDVETQTKILIRQGKIVWPEEDVGLLYPS
jgi:hypothetical protein